MTALSKHPLYATWSAMQQRCNNTSHKAWATHGGKGIKVDTLWGCFGAFTMDMGARPAGYTLQRRDTAENYSRINCFWGPTTTQPRSDRWRAALTDKQVSHIRWLGAHACPKKKIATHFRVSPQTVYKICQHAHRAACQPLCPPESLINRLIHNNGAAF